MDISPSGGLGVCSSGNGKMWIWDTSNGETRVSILITWLMFSTFAQNKLAKGVNFSLRKFLNCGKWSYVTGFTKTVPISTRNEIQFIADY